MQDIQFADGENIFGCRVAAVCIKENQILLSKLKNDDFWTFIGGKPMFGESTAEAAVREFREEVGVTLGVERLSAIIENFFTFDGADWHQYIFCYRLCDAQDSLELFEGEREVADNRNAIYRWFDISRLHDVPLKPDCASRIIEDTSESVLHFVNREN